MYCRTAALVFFLTASIANALELKLTSGEIIHVEDDSDITPAKEPLKGPAPVGAISPRQLFGRQSGCTNPEQRVICGVGCCNNDNYCCEGRSCLWPQERICCQGGHQCYAGGDCCSDGNCCDPGNYCVRNTRTGAIGCRAYSGGSNSSNGSSGSNSDNSERESSTTTSTIRRTTTSRTTITSAASMSTSTSMRTSTSTATGQVQGQGAGLIPSSCKDSGYKPCPDQKFCCPSDSYCYYDAKSAPRCWDSQYYFYYYSYSWSYSFGVRYYTTYTRYNFNTIGGVSKVPAITVPPLPSAAPESNPNPTSQRTAAISTPTVGSSLGVGGLAGGSVGSSGTGSSSGSSVSPSSASSGSSPASSGSSPATTDPPSTPTPFTPNGNAGATATQSAPLAAGGGASSGAEAVIVATHMLWLALGFGIAGLLMSC